MYRTFLNLAMVTTLCALGANAQMQRRASIRGNGNPNEGKCTIEVVVDGAADVEVRGDTANLRNLSGQQPQFRRFECSSSIPDRPAQFRVRGIDGRGRIQLMQDPRNGGPAVIRIEDSAGGAEGYTFDLEWGGGGDYRTGDYRNDRPGGGYPGGGGGYPGSADRVGGSPFTAEQAVRVCEQSVRDQAVQRFNTPNIRFVNTRIDDNPGRRDWVMGTFAVRRFGREDTHRFSCSVDFSTGRVRSSEIDWNGGMGGPGNGRPGARREAVEICRDAVSDRIRQSGHNEITFGSIRVDDRPGRNDWVIGNASGRRGPRWEEYQFSCNVNLDTGNVRSVDVNRR